MGAFSKIATVDCLTFNAVKPTKKLEIKFKNLTILLQ